MAPRLPGSAEGGHRHFSRGDAEAPSNLAWQRFFADAGLRQLIERALVNNRDLRIAIEHRAGACAVPHHAAPTACRRWAWASAAAASPTGEDQPIAEHLPGRPGRSAFELDLFGRVRNLSEAALAQYLATEEARKTTQISLISSVANAYLRCWPTKSCWRSPSRR